jgi:hypothetical protein
VLARTKTPVKPDVATLFTLFWNFCSALLFIFYNIRFLMPHFGHLANHRVGQVISRKSTEKRP